MKQSEYRITTLKETPKDADNISSTLLLRGGFIDKLAAGVYSFLPLGYKVLDKIANIIRKEMNENGGQEILMPSLIPQELWEETKRWDTMDPPLFTVSDRHERKYGLGSTHEEVIVDLMRTKVSSYQDLPFMLYQIQNKFRNEMRSTGGLLRVREFWMKDAYSFHTDEKDLDRYYEIMKKAYVNIFSSMGLETRIMEASSGSIGGKISNEFAVLTPTGEDTVVFCTLCDWAANVEVAEDVKRCPVCEAEITREKGIEVGHIFKLGTKYSEPMNFNYTAKDGSKKPVFMGCYGIGVGRLMATAVEASHDNKGIIWQEAISPFEVHLMSLGSDDKVKKAADKVYNDLIKKGIDVLYDDRDESAGTKFADADLIGISKRVVVSEKTLKEDSVGLKKRGEKEEILIKIKELVKKLK